MALHEYVLRREGFPDEVLISDRQHGAVGELVTLHNRLWKVTAIESPKDSTAVDRRVLVPADERRNLSVETPR